MSKQDNKFVLQTVQPGLAGLMDGTVSTIGPIITAAFASHKPHFAFLVGIGAAVSAGISMAFAEGLSDDGVLTGRGHPFRRGLIIGSMTFVGGIFHTLPFLISSFHAALITAAIVVAVELFAIAYIRHRFFKMAFWKSVAMVVVGGMIVFAAGVLIGTA